MSKWRNWESCDSDEPTNFIEYPPEFLHSLNDSGLPPHELKLKKNCPVILLRNLNPAAGLCNGTRFGECCVTGLTFDFPYSGRDVTLPLFRGKCHVFGLFATRHVFGHFGTFLDVVPRFLKKRSSSLGPII